MIPGIEILSQNTVSDAAPGMVFAIIMFLCFVGFILSLSLIVGACDNKSIAALISSSFLLICFCLMCGFCIWRQVNPEIHTEYKVLIDDTASWHDIYNKYEIIDQEGKIYTIKEKTK